MVELEVRLLTHDISALQLGVLFCGDLRLQSRL